MEGERGNGEESVEVRDKGGVKVEAELEVIMDERGGGRTGEWGVKRDQPIGCGEEEARGREVGG